MKLVLQLVLLNFVFCASAHREHDNIPTLRPDNDHTRSGLLDKLKHSLLRKPVHNHKKRKIVDHTRIGKDGKVYHAKHYVKGLLHEDSVIEDLPHRCNAESHPKIEQIHSYYSLSDKQKREWDQNGKTEPERRRRLSDDTIAANGVIRPMKLILIPQGSPDCGETCVNSTTWAKAIYLRETIMPRLQSKLAEIFTVTTWRNSIITDGGIASDTPCVWDASNTFSNPKYNSDFPDEEGDYYLMYDMFAFTNPFTVAAAGNCYTINADKRPVIGTAVFAPNYFGPEFNLASQVHTAVHETFHALGFNDNVIGEVTGGLGRETQRQTTRFYVTSEYATEFA